ncbi:MAG: DUF115 domain-containing protein [Spirochaetaceae bacterium]|jgi:hypothetical protein|nr:DUF115 domain-containing protein [Spirochaetaceae bacterium]
MAGNVRFERAKNGMPLCSVGEIRLHSLYDPVREGERFVAAQNPSFMPAMVVVTEPALSYCAPFFAARFPRALTCAIRYSQDFSVSNAHWDRILFAGGKGPEDIGEALFAAFGEEKLCAALFVSWKPSERAFPETSAVVWRGIREAVSKARDVLGTREYFARRWINNAARFCVHLEHPARVLPGTMPVLIAASGPSLEAVLPCLRRFRRNFFVIALSSALEALLRWKIIPDLCFSADGGYWAKKHLAPLVRNPQIPLACPAESAVPAAVLERNPVVPLTYTLPGAKNSALESLFLKECGIGAAYAPPNGTVSGTAAEFALRITSGEVFFCGLDLCTGKGFPHGRPNALEHCGAAKDCRTAPGATRLTRGEFSSGALGVYRRWFAARDGDFVRRVARLSAAPYADSLGGIRDLRFDGGYASGTIKPRIVTGEGIPGSEIRAARLRCLASQTLADEETTRRWLKELFPAQYLTASRHRDGQELAGLMEKLAAFAAGLERSL